MDKILEGLVEFAALRGRNYVKGYSPMWDIRKKTAEFAVLLLLFVKQTDGVDDEDMKTRLTELQPYVDDLRRSIFHLKCNKVPAEKRRF